MPDARALLSIEGLRGGYGGKPVLQGVEPSTCARRGHCRHRPQRRRKIDDDEDGDRASPGDRGRDPFQRRATSQGETPHARARRGIGYVPQGREVFPRMTVEENLQVGAEHQRRAQRADFEPVYAYFPILKERRRQAAGTLSGGQQQQLAIGRVLVGQPTLLLLDEPSEGIQPSIVQDIARIVVELNRQDGPDGRPRRAEHRHDPRHGAALLRHGQGPHRRGTDLGHARRQRSRPPPSCRLGKPKGASQCPGSNNPSWPARPSPKESPAPSTRSPRLPKASITTRMVPSRSRC